MTEVINKTGYNKGSEHYNRKGGKILQNGYWYILVPDHPFCDCKGYVAEHRLRMEEYLERYLTKKEEVHHLDLNRENNRMGNLMLFANHTEHARYELWGNQRSKKDLNNRFCLLCNNKANVDKKTGYEDWHIYQDVFICGKCYKREQRKRKKLVVSQ